MFIYNLFIWSDYGRRFPRRTPGNAYNELNHPSMKMDAELPGHRQVHVPMHFPQRHPPVRQVGLPGYLHRGQERVDDQEPVLASRRNQT